MQKLIIQNKILDGIPLNEYYLKNRDYKGLIFVQHGYLSNKEVGGDYLALSLARMGYFVVAIDAYKHGQRKEEPFITGEEKDRLTEVLGVIKRTALDIIKLHRKHYTQYNFFDIIGVSLGGMIAYYLATKTSKIRKLIPVISTPGFYQKAVHALSAAGLDEDIYLQKDAVDFIRSIDPLQNVEKIQYKELFIICGERDNIVPMTESIKFYNEYKSDRVFMRTYETEHVVNREMQKDIYKYIENKNITRDF